MPDTNLKAAEEMRTAEDAKNNPPPESYPPKRGRGALIVISIVLAAIILILGAAAVYCVLPVEIEVGGTVEIPALTKLPPLEVICQMETDPSSIDTSAPGEHELRLKLFGFLPITTILRVHDTTPPLIETRALYVMAGIELSPAYFVTSVTDATDVTFAFDAPVTADADGTVKVIATDMGGNITTAEVSYFIDPELSDSTFELGFDAYYIENELMKLHDFDTLTMDSMDVTKCGIYPIFAQRDGRTFLFPVELVDTTAPNARVHSYDLLLGQTLAIEDFVTNLSDESEVTAAYIIEPDFSKVGKQQLKILLTDAHGNTRTVIPELYIHNVKSTLVLEVGTTTEAFLKAMKAMIGTNAALPRIAGDFKTDHLPIGTYETALIGEFSTIGLEIIIVDNFAPDLTLRELTVYIGDQPEAADFVSSCIDKSPVTFSCTTSIDVSKETDIEVTITATDAAGNKTSAETMLHVTKDRMPPVIHGVKNLSAYEGESLSYRSGVYATDDRDGNVTVKIDASKVKTSVAGTYYVTYTATDSDGNVGTATAKVTIQAITLNAVYPLADQILSQIITDSMTDKQKARAIYDWCTDNLKYSTRTSHLMGHFAKAAYSGFKLHYGNCYTYYAVASALLTRAGISNMEIRRNDPNDPHYWNLVSIGGSWYHFDTCPQPAPHKLEVFLLTDKKVKEFSTNNISGYYSFDTSKYPATP